MKDSQPKKNTFFFLLPYILGFLAIGTLPEILAWAARPEGKFFTGALINLDDLNIYLSAIRQGASGSWLYTPQVSPENIPAHLAFFPYILIGHLLHPQPDQLILSYTILRLTGFGFAIFAIAKLVETLYPSDDSFQHRAMLFILFSSGVGWVVAGFSRGNFTLTPDLTTPEWDMITAYLSAPHFLWGIAFQALSLRAVITITDKWALHRALGLFLWSVLLGLSYPYIIPVVGLIPAVTLLRKIFTENRFPLRYFLQIGIGAVPMVFFLVYYGFLLPRNPHMQLALIANNQIAPPSPLGLLFSWSLFISLAVIGIRKWLHTGHTAVIPIWVLASAGALYLPLSFSGRFLLGLFIPVILLAHYGFEQVALPKILSSPDSKNHGEGLKFTRIFLFLTIPSNIFFLVFAFQSAQTAKDFPFYIQETEIQALEWLADNATPSDLILADYPIGAIAPRYLPAKVFIGHLNLTIDLDEKRSELLSFYDPQTTLKEREQFISTWGITYIYQGTYESRISKETITLPGEMVYQNEDAAIYAVNPTGQASP